MAGNSNLDLPDERSAVGFSRTYTLPPPAKTSDVYAGLLLRLRVPRGPCENTQGLGLPAPLPFLRARRALRKHRNRVGRNFKKANGPLEKEGLFSNRTSLDNCFKSPRVV